VRGYTKFLSATNFQLSICGDRVDIKIFFSYSNNLRLATKMNDDYSVQYRPRYTEEECSDEAYEKDLRHRRFEGR